MCVLWNNINGASSSSATIVMWEKEECIGKVASMGGNDWE